ncbi:ABC1 family protein C21C3.03, mitochondrial-like isoform X2 [Asparagus officinalis]|uniref:ABC1 family protein C21C3.03, mitochondrial-like isoform X2 n=1 Tax=Asparagus officinalis TaxID=4686 RepID=UPI00098E638B|nr:ABC1 family protein C21C3.03, mitochondrial-like isoform X2 [Asparagus officinalis]
MVTNHWVLAFGKIRKVGYALISNHRLSYSSLQVQGTFYTNGFPFPCRAFSQDKAFKRGNLLFNTYRANKNLYRDLNINKFSVSSNNGSITCQALATWKRLSVLSSYRGLSSSLLSRMACAMSLAFTRFHMVPTVLAFIGGNLACTQQALADGERFKTRNNLCMQAQDRDTHLALVFSVLEIFVLLVRALYLAILFSPSIVMAPLSDTLGIKYRKTWISLIRYTLEKSGPAFIKWGQWAATRPDLFADDLCSELAKLHSKAPAHGFSYTKKVIEKAFGRKLSDIFENFEEDPVASGSIAQVHRASLSFRYPGQQSKKMVVAVKVRHPGVSESIRRDFMIINTVAKVSRFIPALKWLRLDESVQQFAVFMMSQVDLAREAAHLSRFIYNFRRWKDVSFPRPLYPLVHPAVLVETYEQGEKISHYVDELEGNNQVKSALAHIGSNALLKMLLVDNFIHADLHPGNILVRESRWRSSNKGLLKPKPHVVFLDVGMTAELSSSDRINLLEFFKAVSLRDGRRAARSTLMLSKQQNCPNPKAFVEGWQRKLDPDYDVMQTLQALLFKSDWAESLSYTIKGLAAP